jgi:phenylacetate-CoA ligase
MNWNPPAAMMPTTSADRRQLELLDRAALERRQLERLNQLLQEVLPDNRFYAAKFAGVKLPLASLEQLAELPLTTKDELIGDGSRHALPANLTWPLERYVRFHQTSGTHGRPLAVYDTADDWRWWMEVWQYVLDAADVTAADRALLAFSFGPFIGFWSAHDALVARGAMVVPGGGLSSRARLELIERTGASVLFCTPSYALRLAETAQEHGVDLAATSIGKIIVAGEPGGSIPAVRDRIESAWQARVYDHAGASEIGPWGYADAQRRGLHVMESEFIAEFLPWTGATVSTDAARHEGVAELVLTSLGRKGMPAIRYRTGDLVRPTWPDAGPNRFVLLAGGVLGRADDMLVIRGVNVFPSAIEQIIRSFPEVVEYRMTVRQRGAMDELAIEVEDRLDRPQRIAEELNVRLGMNVEVRSAPLQSLPRFEGKGRRLVDERKPAKEQR